MASKEAFHFGELQVSHFGTTIKSKDRGLKLTPDNYATKSNKSSFGKNNSFMYAKSKKDDEFLKAYENKFADECGLIYTDEWCEKQYIKAMQNFELNMKFFKRLDHDKFNEEINKFIKKYKFTEISDLNKYDCSGFYMLVIDEYCQVYIGTSEDIKRRIRQHWAGGKLKFDRLVFGNVETSKLSIDSFRALDSTRIFVFPTIHTYSKENEYIEFFSKEFVCNRIGGGIMEFGTLSIMANVIKREL